MADGMQQTLERITECSICCDTFTSPKLLPCGHTFCAACIERYGSGQQPGQSMCCPLCRSAFVVPPSGLQGLPASYVVSELLAMTRLGLRQRSESTEEDVKNGCGDTKDAAKPVNMEKPQGNFVKQRSSLDNITPVPAPRKLRTMRSMENSSTANKNESSQDSDMYDTVANDELSGHSWYFGGISRADAEKKITDIDEDGTFMIRRSQQAGPSSPYTLSVVRRGRVYHVRIRVRPDRMYALGAYKEDEIVFESVAELVDYYEHNALQLLNDNNEHYSANKVVLVEPPPK